MLLVGTCEASRFDSKVTGRFQNFESPRLPRLPSYHKQHSPFNDKLQSFRHCYWDLYWVTTLLAVGQPSTPTK